MKFWSTFVLSKVRYQYTSLSRWRLICRHPVGLKRLDNGALVKDYEGPEKETEQAVQMIVSDVHSEDPRFMEKEPPPLSEEFPVDSKVFFLGEHAYGVAAQISATTTDTLSVVLAVSCVSASHLFHSC